MGAGMGLPWFPPFLSQCCNLGPSEPPQAVFPALKFSRRYLRQSSNLAEPSVGCGIFNKVSQSPFPHLYKGSDNSCFPKGFVLNISACNQTGSEMGLMVSRVMGLSQPRAHQSRCRMPGTSVTAVLGPVSLTVSKMCFHGGLCPSPLHPFNPKQVTDS